MRLQGTVQDSSTVQVAYQIEQVSSGQAISQHSFTVAGSSTGTTFNQVMAELAAGNSTLQEEEPYNLILTSTDVAGNSQRSRFQFFVPSARKVTDDDPWTEDNDNDPTTPVKDPTRTTDPVAGNIGTWGYVGTGGSWGYYAPGGGAGTGDWMAGYGGGLSEPDKTTERGLVGNGYEYDYVESIDHMVDQAVDLISTAPGTIHKKAALQNRKDILVEIGKQLSELILVDENFRNDQALINRMAPVMEGLFVDAYDPAGSEAGIYERFAPWGGAWLAQSLVSDPLSVRVQVFQATLLSVVTEATPGVTTVAQQEALAAAVLELAKTYAWLNPNPETTVPAADQDFGFLDKLWRLQVPNANGVFKSSGDIAAALNQSVLSLKTLLTGVNDPVRAIQFLNNLVQAASNVTSLKADVKDAKFLRELVEFGVEFAKLNPTATDSANSDEAVSAFLNTLWQGKQTDVKQAEGGLSSFFVGLDTLDKRIKVLDFANNLIDTAQQVSSLGNQKKDAKFLSQLVGLGSAYTALNPSTTTVSAEMPFDFFLDTIYKNQNQGLPNGAHELEVFLNGFDTPIQQVSFLALERKALTELNLAPELQQKKNDVINVSTLSAWVRAYALEYGTELSVQSNDAIDSYIDGLLWIGDDTSFVSTGMISNAGGGSERDPDPGKAKANSFSITIQPSPQTPQVTKFGQFSMDINTPRAIDSVFLNKLIVDYDVQLRFKPNQKLNSAKIAMVQTVLPLINNKPFQPQGQEDRALLQGEGPPGSIGLSIDRYSRDPQKPFIYPYYGMDNTGGNLANVRFGVSTSNNSQMKDAVIRDRPGSNSLLVGDTLEYTFETYAIAVDKGTYYGSVSWGFKFDAQGNFLEKPLTLVSQARPTASFLAAAKKWNSQKFMINGISTPAIPLPLK